MTKTSAKRCRNFRESKGIRYRGVISQYACAKVDRWSIDSTPLYRIGWFAMSTFPSADASPDDPSDPNANSGDSGDLDGAGNPSERSERSELSAGGDPFDPAMDPAVTTIQPGGGTVMSIELAWGRFRRWYLTRFRKSYVERMLAVRQGQRGSLPFDPIDPR